MAGHLDFFLFMYGPITVFPTGLYKITTQTSWEIPPNQSVRVLQTIFVS